MSWKVLVVIALVLVLAAVSFATLSVAAMRWLSVPPAAELEEPVPVEKPGPTLPAAQQSRVVQIVKPADADQNLMWAMLQCHHQKGDRELCALGGNTAASLEMSGNQVQICAVWRKDEKDPPRGHCLELEVPKAEAPAP